MSYISQISYFQLNFALHLITHRHCPPLAQTFHNGYRDDLYGRVFIFCADDQILIIHAIYAFVTPRILIYFIEIYARLMEISQKMSLKYVMFSMCKKISFISQLYYTLLQQQKSVVTHD